jgi:hypothetical protein
LQIPEYHVARFRVSPSGKNYASCYYNLDHCGHLLLPASLLAQSATPAQRLAGQTRRVWVFQRIERIMGAGDNCKSGEQDEFSADDSVTITKCENSKLVHRKQTWSVRNDGVDDWIKIGMDEYQLLFTHDANTMTLRKVSTEKPTATVDKDYRRQSEYLSSAWTKPRKGIGT